MAGFVIHAVPVSTGILALSQLPGRGGDYTADLAHVRDWQPALVLSLTSQSEMDAYDAGGLGSDLMESGVRWVHLPVPDFGVPDAETNESWAKAASDALAALAGGGRVLVHCNAGCGRSGMAALRLMIAAGEAPQDALARLRAVRPCAVETDAQMHWAMAV